MTIGIFTALEKEADSFLRQCKAIRMNDGHFSVWEFMLGGCNAVLCCPPSVGEIAASAACQLLISKYKVDIILNFGIAGALTDQTALLSTVFAKSVVHYTMDTSAVDGIEKGRYQFFDGIAVECDRDLLAAGQSVCDLPAVRCASADKFVADPQEKQDLSDRFGTQICDMESAGVLFTCKFNGVSCLIVKCISDSLCGGADEYEQNSRKAANGFFDYAQKLALTLNSGK